MGLFARNATWLKNYFTPSVTPGFVMPTAVSDDVQLVHPYSSGWEQTALRYFFTDSILNPGQNNNLFCVIPPGSPTNDPEFDVVWRVILANISIPAGPTGDFDFDMWIGDNATAAGRNVEYDFNNTIAAGVTTRQMLYPTSRVEATWAAILTRSGPRVTGLGIVQRSAQAASSEGIVIDAWILRAPLGGSIGWP